MIEATIHARLAGDAALATLVGGNFYPTQPAVNPTPPFTFITVTSADTNLYNSGPSSLTKYTFTVDSWATTAAGLWPIMDRIKTVLHGWRGGVVQLCSEVGHTTDQQEAGFHGTQTYALSANEGSVGALPDQSGTITPGTDTVVRLNGLKNSTTGQYQNAASVTGELLDLEGNVLYAFGLTYQSGTRGNYLGTIPAAETELLDAPATYRIRVTAVSGGITLIVTYTAVTP